MEELGQSYGYILYRSTLRGPREPRTLTVESIHDRAQIFLDGEKKEPIAVGRLLKKKSK